MSELLRWLVAIMTGSCLIFGDLNSTPDPAIQQCFGVGVTDDSDNTKTSESETKSESETNTQCPEGFSEYIWNTGGISEMLPSPDTEWAYYVGEYNDYFYAEYAYMTRDEFNDYCNKCISMGFNVDYFRMEDLYYAYNSDGYYLWLCRKDGIVSISLSK